VTTSGISTGVALLGQSIEIYNTSIRWNGLVWINGV